MPSASKIIDKTMVTNLRRLERAGKAFVAAPPAKPASKPAQTKKKGSKHVSSVQAPKAVLTKAGHPYAQNCHDFIKQQPGYGGRSPQAGTVFGTFDHAHLRVSQRVQDAVVSCAKFPGGPARNFNPGARKGRRKAGQSFPYTWEAHHMLPANAFYGKDDFGRRMVTDKQLRILKLSDYNINDGHNMIPLPDTTWAPPVHMLLQHPSDHIEYNAKIAKEMKSVADEIDKLIAKGKPHEDAAKDFRDGLRDLENDNWKLIVGLGRASVRAVVAGREYQDSHVLYEAKTTGGKYPFGRLY